MGNIMLCGSLCQSCEASTEANVEQNNNMQANIDQILINEIAAREKTEKMIDKEIKILKENVDMSIMNIKGICDGERKILHRNILQVESETAKSISSIQRNIEKIQENHLNHIENDLSIIKTRIDNTNEDIKEIKYSLKEISTNVIKNTAQLEFYKK